MDIRETMKKSLIPWHIFRDALESQDADALEHWLDHWGFTNDGVVLISMDTRSGSPLLSFERRENGSDAVALNLRASLGDLVQLLSRDANFFMDEAAKLWSYTNEL
jgi:hypothetical protein